MSLFFLLQILRKLISASVNNFKLAFCSFAVCFFFRAGEALFNWKVSWRNLQQALKTLTMKSDSTKRFNDAHLYHSDALFQWQTHEFHQFLSLTWILVDKELLWVPLRIYALQSECSSIFSLPDTQSRHFVSCFQVQAQVDLVGSGTTFNTVPRLWAFNGSVSKDRGGLFERWRFDFTRHGCIASKNVSYST